MKTQLMLVSLVTAIGVWVMFWAIASVATLYALSMLPVAPAAGAPTFVLEEVMLDTAPTVTIQPCAAARPRQDGMSGEFSCGPAGITAAGRRASAPRRGRPSHEKRR